VFPSNDSFQGGTALTVNTRANPLAAQQFFYWDAKSNLIEYPSNDAVVQGTGALSNTVVLGAVPSTPQWKLVGTNIVSAATPTLGWMYPPVDGPITIGATFSPFQFVNAVVNVTSVRYGAGSSWNTNSGNALSLLLSKFASTSGTNQITVPAGTSLSGVFGLQAAGEESLQISYTIPGNSWVNSVIYSDNYIQNNGIVLPPVGFLLASAWYGFGGNFVNVQDVLQKLIVNNSLTIPAKSSPFGLPDPAPGFTKTLFFGFSVNGGPVKSYSFDDNYMSINTIVLP